MESATTIGAPMGEVAPPGKTAPIQETARIASIDVLRGAALLGILLMNIQSFSMTGDAYLNPTAYGDLTGINHWVWIVVHIFADQKFINIFSMLFGAGIVLMAGRMDASRFRMIHYRRMLVLVLFGVLHAHLVWSGDILYFYGMCGMLIYLARNLRPRRLIVLGLVLYAVGTVIYIYFGVSMRSWPPETLANFTHDMWRSTPAEQLAELAAYRGGWLKYVGRTSADATDMETWVFALDIFWKVSGLMLLGMALFRLRVFTAERSTSFYRRLMLLGFGIGFPVIAFGAWTNFSAGWDVRYSFFFGSQFNYWGSVPMSLGWIGAVILLYKSSVLTGLQRRLAAVGRTALSNYILQTIIGSLIFYGTGLGLFGSVSRVVQVVIVFAVWAVQLTVSPLWLRHFIFGPLEWLWRSLTYGRAQPMRVSAIGRAG